MFLSDKVLKYNEVESRMYKESLSGVTAKSQGTLSKVDERELFRLQQKDYWLQISKAKLRASATTSSF